jgi:c-di-GMP-binding flagellar brake protein YcgR
VEVESNESQATETEKRRYRRAKLITQVKCEALGREAVVLTRDVSAGGMFLNDPNPFPSKSTVNLAFRLEPTAPLLTCRGEVVYSIQGVGMGVMFTEIPEAVRQALENFVDAAN